MAEFVKKTMGPPNIKAMSSNTLSDAYRDAITIAYQYIGASVASIDFVFGGRHFGTPIMAGPIGFPKDKTENGVVGYARAVNEAGSVYWATYHDPEDWKQILAEGIPAVRVIKPLADMDKILEEIRYDTEHGALAYAMDIDHGIDAYGRQDGQGQAFAPKTVEELKRLNEASPLPFFLKGVPSLHDALAAVEAGVAGIVVSGHNNRFPCAVPPLKILPQIREAVGDKLMILVDGGMNTGYDVFKALALGADGVLSARALCAAYVKEGEEGLTYKLLEMTAELKGAMGNTGSPDLKHINRDCLILP
jgi:isopentenyl diphosphate isomerase/L-lactate dehydrogenase-like FMN-dependent dehydrogenase